MIRASRGSGKVAASVISPGSPTKDLGGSSSEVRSWARGFSSTFQWLDVSCPLLSHSTWLAIEKLLCRSRLSHEHCHPTLKHAETSPSMNYQEGLSGNTATLASKLTRDTVSKHNSSDSCWVVLYGNVYDVETSLSLVRGHMTPFSRSAGDLIPTIAPRRLQDHTAACRTRRNLRI